MKFGAGMRNLGVVGNGDLRTSGLGTGDLGSGDLGSGDLSSADTLGRLGGVLVLSTNFILFLILTCEDDN